MVITIPITPKQTRKPRGRKCHLTYTQVERPKGGIVKKRSEQNDNKKIQGWQANGVRKERLPGNWTECICHRSNQTNCKRHAWLYKTRMFCDGKRFEILQCKVA